MSRTRKAGFRVIFGYIQFGLAFISGILLVPFTLKHVGTQSYGLWLACGELLAYFAMADFGVLSVLPWVIAEKDGQGDRGALRNIIINALMLAVCVSVVYILVVLLAWHALFRFLHITLEQEAILRGPLLIIIVSTAIAFPLRTFWVVLIGLQDVVFGGLISIGQWTLNIVIVVVLLHKGYGLTALAVAVAIPPLLFSVVSLVRLHVTAPDLFSEWTRPSLKQMRFLLNQGFGTWLGGFGWRFISASNSIILVSIGSPAMAVIYVCTSKFGEILMQLGWQLPDSGLIGLAQLHGEGNEERVRHVVLMMLRLSLVIAGGVAFIVLMFNSSLVPLWVGADKFGGFMLTALLAANFIAHSLVHGLMTPVAAIGNRLRIGFITIVQGTVDITVALALGYICGVNGVATSSLLSTLIVGAPLAVRLLASSFHLNFTDVWEQSLRPPLRAFPLLLIGTLIGVILPQQSTLWLMLFAPPLIFLYIWFMRPLYTGIPLPLKIIPWLVRARLLPQQ